MEIVDKSRRTSKKLPSARGNTVLIGPECSKNAKTPHAHVLPSLAVFLFHLCRAIFSLALILYSVGEQYCPREMSLVTRDHKYNDGRG